MASTLIEVDISDYISDFDTDDLIAELELRGIEPPDFRARLAVMLKDLVKAWKAGDTLHFDVTYNRMQRMLEGRE